MLRSIENDSSLKRRLVNTAALLGVVGVVLVAVYGVWVVMNTDALAPFRKKNGTNLMAEGVTFSKSQVKNYKGDRLVLAAEVGQTKVLDDWSVVDWYDVKDGKFYTEEGKVVHFNLKKATYGVYSKAIVSEDPVRVWSDDYDLHANGFVYDDASQTLTVSGAVDGMLDKGDLHSDKVVIKVDKGKLMAYGSTWTGPVAFQDGKKKSVWHFDAGDVEYVNGRSVVTNGKGHDDDQAIKADTMVYEREKDVVTADGNVRYWGKEANLACNHAVIERKEGKATLTGKKPVTMLVKPKGDQTVKQEEIPPLTPMVPDDIKKGRPEAVATGTAPADKAKQVRDTENLRKYPITIQAGQVIYWYKEGSRHAEITGSPWAFQQIDADLWRKMWADKVLYDGEKDLMNLLSAEGKKNVRMENSLGDQFRASSMDIVTTEGVDKYSLHGLADGMYVPQEGEDLPTPPGGGSTGGSGSSTGGSTGGGLSGPIGRG